MTSQTPTEAAAEIARLRTELQAARQRLQAVVQASGSVLGTLEFELDLGGELVLSQADAMADNLLGKSCTPFFGRSILAFLPGLRVTAVPAELAAVARDGGVLGPRSTLGEGMLSGRSYQFFAFQPALNRVVAKFWDGTGAQAQRMAERSQQQLLVVFRESPVAISMNRAADGVYVDVNDEWCRLTGVSFDQALGRTAIDLGFWRDRAERDAGILPLHETGHLRNLDLPFVRVDGEQRILQLNGSRIEIDGTPYFLSYLKDVTAERAAQAALAESEQMLKESNDHLNEQIEFFESMENLATVGHWVSRPGGDGLVWSGGLYALAGLAPGSVTSVTEGRGRILEQDRSIFEAARARLDGATVEYRWAHPDGRVRWLRARMHRRLRDGVAVLDFGVVQDVTAERHAALALQERLAFIQKITSRVPGVVFQLRRRPDGSFQFLYISEPVREIYRGVSPEEVLRDAGCTLALHHPDDLPGFLSALRESARDLTMWRHEYRLRFPDGSVTWLSGQAVPEAEADGGVVWNGVTTDITPRKLVQERLSESEARFRALTELSSDWYWEQDAQFRFVRFEGALVARAGHSGFDSYGKTRWEVGALNMREADWDKHRAVLRAHQTFHDLELQDTDAQGRKFWKTISGEPMFDSQGVFKGYRGIGRNITGRKRAEEKIERLAFFDILTGLPNRRLLLDRLQHALALGDRASRPGALLFIDLDNFKDLNDTQGHDIGDQLLKQVAIRLGECVRGADTVARLGGDEFVVMLEDLGSEPSEAAALAESVARKILATLNQPYRLSGLAHHSTPSIGIALFHDQLSSVDDLLKRADLAMYQAKAAGRNTLRFFDPQMQVVVAARAELEGDLRLGLQRRELLLYYQPVVDESARVIGVEALVRWRHPKRGLVAPGEFIPVAEQSGLILPLGEWVLAQACAQLVTWSALPATARLTVAVNVSARQFRHADFATQVLELLRVSGANPYRLKLEITESLLLSDMDDAIQKMSELRSIGVSFALDDFGTGYSSLAYLKRLPLEQLKIDQSFVRDVMTDPNDAAIALAVLTLGRSLGLTVVAEGVETPEQHALLRNHGCCVFQGYLFGRPVPVEALDLRSAAQAVSSISWMI